VRDRRHHDLGIGNRRERDEEDAVRALVHQLRAGLEREPGLARAPRPGERHQAHAVPPQELVDLGHLPLAADEGRRLDREVGRPVVERPQRRKVAGQGRIDELEEMLRLGQVLQSVVAEVAEPDADVLVLEQIARRVRDEHLAAVAGGADARAAVDADAYVALPGRRHLAGVDADPHAQRTTLGPVVPGERAV